MSNIVSMGQSSEFILTRAARHRRAGRYDEAMALLSKARDQFFADKAALEEIELEAARAYDEMGCDEEAARSYLRVVRLHGRRRGQALFHLSLSCAQRADIRRAVSYYQMFIDERKKRGDEEDPDAISDEMAQLLGRQLHEELERPAAVTAKRRSQALERRAVECLQEGKARAAEYAMKHAVALHPTAQGLTLLACCALIQSRADDAVIYARAAHELSPGRVQTICVLADAYMAAGNADAARRTLCLAALRARKTEDLIAAAIESAKHEMDHLTLRLTKSILKREPYHTRAMTLRACALMNIGKRREAAKLFGRLCGLLPEDSVCEAYYRLAKSDEPIEERLILGMDVLRGEGIARASELMELLQTDSRALDRDAVRRACRLSAWAIRSPMIGVHIRTAALVLLCEADQEPCKEVLLDSLTDAQVADSFKMAALQMLTAKHGFYPYEVDIDGRLVRLAAGGVSAKPTRSMETNQRIVQRAADALSPDYPEAARMMLPLFLRYLEVYETPDSRHDSACAAALEYVFHRSAGRQVNMLVIARRYGVTKRLCALFARRMLRLLSEERSDDTGMLTESE